MSDYLPEAMMALTLLISALLLIVYVVALYQNRPTYYLRRKILGVCWFYMGTYRAKHLFTPTVDHAYSYKTRKDATLAASIITNVTVEQLTH